jgi:uncharacterized DUF497 family protein
MEFEWDENKSEKNKLKHLISFEEAKVIFSIQHHTVISPYTKENRLIAIGSLKNRIMAVVFTPRNGKIRIISVRSARAYEEKEYYEIFPE